MASNLKLDDALVAQVISISGLGTKREAVNLALSEYVRRHQQLEILSLAGTIDYDPDYDYKAARQTR